LKDACSVFKKKLGTGATWSKEESAIEVQGDVYDEIMDIIVQSEWNVCFLVDRLQINLTGDRSRRKQFNMLARERR